MSPKFERKPSLKQKEQVSFERKLTRKSDPNSPTTKHEVTKMNDRSMDPFNDL